MKVNTALQSCRAKRNFAITSEPSGIELVGAAGVLSFVIQKHWATRLHHDYRLELNGTPLSWAVPNDPSFDTVDKRLAMQVENHPIRHAGFEGTIPATQYGAGRVV